MTTAAGVDEELSQVLADMVTDLLDKPRARGWIHLISAGTAAVAGPALVSVAAITSSPMAGWATLTYATTIVAMFSISAAYHRVKWRSRGAEKWMKRIDHSMIFIFIVTPAAAPAYTIINTCIPIRGGKANSAIGV